MRRPIAFGSMSLSFSSLSTTKSVQFKYALMWCVRRHDRDQWSRYLCHAPRIPLTNYLPLLEHSSCAAASSGSVSGTRGHRRRAGKKHLAVRGYKNILFIRRRAKVVHVSCLVSSVFSRSTEIDVCRLRYLHHGTLAPRLDTHGTAPTPTCSTKHTHHLLERNDWNTGHERMFLRSARVQDASPFPCSTASASKMHMKLTFPRRPRTLDIVGSQDGPQFAVQTLLKKKH